MLNFRKLKQDFSSNILKEGRTLHEGSKVVSAKILRLDNDTIRLSAQILGKFENSYESEIEIDRFESQTIHSNCDCTYRYDCQHLAALVFYLEDRIDSLIVQYSKETDLEEDVTIDHEEKQELLETIKEAATKEVEKIDARQQKQVLQEYIASSSVLSSSPFFYVREEQSKVEAELAILFNPKSFEGTRKQRIDFQLALRLPFRSKPLQVHQLKHFLNGIRYQEPIFLGGKRYLFSLNSFEEKDRTALKLIMDHAQYPQQNVKERVQKVGQIDREVFGQLMAEAHKIAVDEMKPIGFTDNSDDLPTLPSLYIGSLETPLCFSPSPAQLRFVLEYLDAPAATILLKPMLVIDHDVIEYDDCELFECAAPGMLYDSTYYPFPSQIKRMHLCNLEAIREMTIPEPLFGTFVENALPALRRFAEITNLSVIEKFVTLPFAGKLETHCELTYLDGELDAVVRFIYDGNELPASSSQLKHDNIENFVTESGILARNLVEEREILDELFQDFVFNPQQGTYVAKTEKKIVEFMTEVIPRNQHRIHFKCPQNLLDQFIYDKTTFELKLDYKDQVGYYEINLKVDGALQGISLDRLWECISSKRSFLELNPKTKTRIASPRFSKILVLDLDRITKLAQVFDELGIQELKNNVEQRPLWNLVTIDKQLFEGLPVKFSISKKLQEIRKQMLGEKNLVSSPIPNELKADLRPYQTDGVHWLERLRSMYLNGILADDMGLGKTLQAIAAITQAHAKDKKATTLIVCPTSLLYNWQEELHRFNPKLKVMVVDGIPSSRKKLIAKIKEYQVVITSYTLLQKDIEETSNICFNYVILDEAQHIKNRGTRNAKSVKQVQAVHRLILTGTPIENSLDELWSLFDFLMPGLLSTYDRFVEKYIRVTGDMHLTNMQYLKKKLSPFIMRRMKADVLKDLPPVSEIVYHCQLSDVQKELYKSYAASARDELVRLVKKEGFDKVQIHVLATLTRLKQICCHPAIFAKEKAETGDSAKYEMLLELLQTLVGGGHKTVIFSQYTQMLHIMREDFKQRGIRFSYLDGSTKNRMKIVNEFNESSEIPVFLVSLKAGGTGLNLVGADTVIHYDMWWNPAVENQATDRVHRMGQKKSVSSYKLITLGTIEEKIVEMQKRKKGLVKKVVSCDDEAIAKLTWEDVLELLQA